MRRLTKDQRVWICLEHARFQNGAEVRRRWPYRWGNTPAPTKRTSSATYKKFLHEATCHDAMVSDELDNAFVLEVTRFRTNKSCLYFVNKNTSFHNKYFAKFHQFTENNTSLS
jgi:hypothetical protein